MHCGTLLKTVSAIEFSEQPSILESLSFHHEVFVVINFELVLHICIVNAMIFIQKNTGKLFQDPLLQRGCRNEIIMDQDPCKSDLELFFLKKF